MIASITFCGSPEHISVLWTQCSHVSHPMGLSPTSFEQDTHNCTEASSDLVVAALVLPLLPLLAGFLPWAITHTRWSDRQKLDKTKWHSPASTAGCKVVSKQWYSRRKPQVVARKEDGWTARAERYYQPSSSEVKCSSVQIMRQPACRSACRSQEEVTRYQAGVPVDAVEVQTCRDVPN